MFSLAAVSMKRITCCMVVTGLFALSSQALVARAADSDGLSALQGLLAENKNLTVQLRKVKKVKEEIDRKDSEIQGATSALKHAQEDLRRRGTRIDEENRRIDEEATRSGCPWGTKSTDLAYVNSCNTLGAKLMGWKEDLKNKVITLAEYAAKLQDEQNRWNQATLKWAAKKKSNNDDLDELSASFADWQRRYNAFVFQSEAYERLKKTAPGARFCEELSRPMTSGALESAAQCLQWLWDGGR